jgi:hypothetical protein
MTRFAAFAVLVLAALSSGCATLSGSATQAIEIHAVDDSDRAIHGMECRVANAAGEQLVTLPAKEVPVRRSSTELEVECRLGAQIARGTAVARGDAKMENSFIPGGSIAALVDHFSGYMYSYPTPLRLRVGEHLRFEFSDAPRAELVAALAPAGTATPAPASPLPVVTTRVIPAQVPAPSAAPGSAAAASRAPVRPAPTPRPVAAAPAAPPPVKYESLDPRDLRLRSGAN